MLIMSLSNWYTYKSRATGAELRWISTENNSYLLTYFIMINVVHLLYLK